MKPDSFFSALSPTLQPKQPRVIQRCEIRHTQPPQNNCPFSLSMWQEYMYSAEFEVRRRSSLRNLCHLMDAGRLRVTPIPAQLLGEEMFLLHGFESIHLTLYRTYLQHMRLGILPTLEKTLFEDYIPPLQRICDLWWDLENHAMWTPNRAYAEALPALLKEEFKEVDRRRQTSLFLSDY